MEKGKPRKKATPAELVEAMQHFGAKFQFTTAGSLLVRNLAALPAVVIDDFLNVEQKPFVAAVRALPCSAEVAR